MKRIIAAAIMVASFSSLAEEKIKDFEMYCTNVSIVYKGTSNKTVSENYGMFVAVHNASSGDTFITATTFNGMINETTKITEYERSSGLSVGFIVDGVVGISKDQKSVYIKDEGDVIFVHEDQNNCTKKYNARNMKTLQSM